MQARKDNNRGRRGSALVEFALSVGVIVPLFTGVFQFGYALWTYNQLANHVRAGARYASLKTFDAAGATPSADFRQAVQNMVAYGTPSPAIGITTPGAIGVLTPATVSGLSPSQVTLTVGAEDGLPGVMTVAVSGYTVSTIFGNFTLTDKPAMTFDYMGRYAAP